VGVQGTALCTSTTYGRGGPSWPSAKGV